MTHLPDFVEALGDGIFAIDTGFHRDRFDAAYLLVQGGRAAFIDTGTNFAVPRLLSALQSLGIERDAVEWVIPTHVHLDHAGGVGLLLQQLPAARLMVHPAGARHLIDPSRLWAGATAVYGAEEMARSYGELLPVAADRVVESSDGMCMQVGDRELLLIHTPGHARHHHCLWDAASRGWFTGDTFGLSYREFDSDRGAWVVPTTTLTTAATGAMKGSAANEAARASAIRTATPKRARAGRLTARIASRAQIAAAPTITVPMRTGMSAVPRSSMPRVTIPPGVSSAIACASETTTEGTPL